MTRKDKPPREPTAKERADWKDFCDDLDGKFVPLEPDNINIAREVDEAIKLFGFEEGAIYAHLRAECAYHEEDTEDWTEVERIIRERKAKHDKNAS